MQSKEGFTLIEVLIAMLVSLVIMGGAYMFFNTQQRQTTIQTNVSDTQQILRAAMDYVVRDVRMAGYDPHESGKFGINDISSISLGGKTVSRIRFSWDKNSDGKLEEDWNGTSGIQPEEAEQMEYSLVNNSTITDGVNDLYLKYPGAADSDREVLAANITTIGFAYAYDDDDDGKLDRASGNIIWGFDNGGNWLNLDTNGDGDITAADDADGDGLIDGDDTGTSIDRDTIRVVRIWMLAQAQAPDPKYTDTKTYVVGPHISSPATRPDNRFRHRLLERTVLCRNMGLNL